ncbi:MAG: gamma-glutamyl-gamma-aminobutyrate hydrolase family protein [Planctomycetia bacterium]|nr:gamma-glutamyl-gamma-aminobutyrate hydrolase family protein [Planctomycetia bacterium]
MTRPEQRPFIGINVENKPARDCVPEIDYLFAGYKDAIERAGGIPVILPPVSEEIIPCLLSRVDACLFVGGPDLDPRRDGFMVHPYTRMMSPRRERFDRALMDAVAKRRMPVMGIGVGMQLLNVSQGGALSLHIPEDFVNAIKHCDPMDRSLRHTLEIEKGTLLDAAYGGFDAYVSSSHHMAVDDVAPGFIVSARCPNDGVIEAIESTQDDWFAFGVQFHPESPEATLLDQRIFTKFIEGVVAYQQTARNIFAWSSSKASNSRYNAVSAPHERESVRV